MEGASLPPLLNLDDMKVLRKGEFLALTKPNILSPNTMTDFTRRIPSLPKKQAARDSRIALAIVKAYDVEHDNEKVKRLFFHNAKFLSNPRYWEIMRTVWIAVGSTENAKEFVPFMRSDRPSKKWFMTPEDSAELEGMSFPIRVYRAFDNDEDPGISWSVDKSFVERYASVKNRKIKSRLVKREDVFAYITRRGESEIIIIPDDGDEKGSDV